MNLEEFTSVNRSILDDIYSYHLENECNSYDLLSYTKMVESIYNTNNRDASMYNGIKWEII